MKMISKTIEDQTSLSLCGSVSLWKTKHLSLCVYVAPASPLDVKELKDVHRLLFGTPGSAHNIRMHIRQFSGFVFEAWGLNLFFVLRVLGNDFNGLRNTIT